MVVENENKFAVKEERGRLEEFRLRGFVSPIMQRRVVRRISPSGYPRCYVQIAILLHGCRNSASPVGPARAKCISTPDASRNSRRYTYQKREIP